MALPVEIHANALEETGEARRWYARRSPAAAFLNEPDHAIDEIVQHPDRRPVHLHGTRRYLLRRFPLPSRLSGSRRLRRGDRVRHGHQRPGYWRDRIGGK